MLEAGRASQNREKRFGCSSALRKAWPCRQIHPGRPRKAWPCRQIALAGWAAFSSHDGVLFEGPMSSQIAFIDLGWLDWPPTWLPFGVASGCPAKLRLGRFGPFGVSGRALGGRCPVFGTKSFEKHVFYCVISPLERFLQNPMFWRDAHLKLRFQGLQKLHFWSPNDPFWKTLCRPQPRKYCK